MSESTVLIVGAGPTGMALAIELKRAGLGVRIIDKSDHPALHFAGAGGAGADAGAVSAIWDRRRGRSSWGRS